MRIRRQFIRPVSTCLAAGLLVVSSAIVLGQPAQFQFALSVLDASGTPVTDLTIEEIVYAENGQQGTVQKIEPFPIPLKLTISVDNGSESVDAFSHYRSGLTGLIQALPSDVEVTLISASPQPRKVVRRTANRQEILRGINGFAPERDDRPRFTDVLVEFAQELDREMRASSARPYIPVLLMVSTTANEQTSYSVPEIERALKTLGGRRAKVFVAITSTRAGPVAAGAEIDTNRQAIIGIPATKITGGKYEALAISSRLATLLPEWGKEFALWHTRHNNQLRVTVQRPGDLTGPFQSLQVEVARAGMTLSVSRDGMP
jgi:hypothetical protein